MTDLDALAAIHAAAFTVPRPWSAGEIAAVLAGQGAFLCEVEGGFLVGRCLAGEAEILTLAVHPEARRQGQGAALVARFLDLARAGGARRVFLEVAEDNAAALALYLRAGFAPAGRRPGYYRLADGSAVDALILARVS